MITFKEYLNEAKQDADLPPGTEKGEGMLDKDAEDILLLTGFDLDKVKKSLKTKRIKFITSEFSSDGAAFTKYIEDMKVVKDITKEHDADGDVYLVKSGSNLAIVTKRTQVEIIITPLY